MLWTNASALFAIAAVAVPILIHILVQRRAERFPFPTLRFLQPTRLAAIRRHVLEDAVLLLVRAANKVMKAKEEAPAAPAPDPEEVLLLREIRDALKKG